MSISLGHDMNLPTYYCWHRVITAYTCYHPPSAHPDHGKEPASRYWSPRICYQSVTCAAPRTTPVSRGTMCPEPTVDHVWARWMDNKKLMLRDHWLLGDDPSCMFSGFLWIESNYIQKRHQLWTQRLMDCLKKGFECWQRCRVEFLLKSSGNEFQSCVPLMANAFA